MKQIIDGEFISLLDGHDLNRKTPMNGMFGGNRRSNSYGSSTEFAEYRDYIPGDDLRRIDWNLYARFERLLTKLYIDEKQQHHRIYIDTSNSMDWGEPSKADTAFKLAAALGYLGVTGLDRVTFYELNGKRIHSLGKTISTREGFYGIAERLNHLQCKGSTDFSVAFRSTPNLGSNDGVSIIISDFLTDSNWKVAVDQLLFHKREVWLIQILSPDEIAPGMHGKMLFLDSEGLGEEDPLNYKTEVTRSEVQAYTEAFNYLERDIKDFCASRGVKFIFLSTEKSVESMLFETATEAEMII